MTGRRARGATLVGAALASFLAACTTYTPPATHYPGVVALALPPATQAVAGAPTGDRLAFSDPAGLATYDLASGAVTRLEAPGGGQPWLAWAPDGGTLYYRASGRQVEAYDLDDGTVMPLDVADPGDVRRVFPSPAGNFLAVVKARGLYLYDVSRKSEQRLTSEAPRPYVAWAPDGRRLAYVEPGERPRLVVLPIFGGSAAVVAQPGIDTTTMACTPEEERLFFAPDGEAVGVVQPSTRSAVAVRTFATSGAALDDRSLDMGDRLDLRRTVDCYHPSPDGRWLVALRGGDVGSQDRPGGLIGVEVATGRVAEVGPPATFVAWVGTEGRFVFSSARNLDGITRFYLGRAGG